MKQKIIKNILICFGTRPEAIKMAPVIHELQNQNISFQICVTAQHREMLDQVLEFFEIIPDYDLNVMKSGQSLNQLSAAIFNEFDKILEIFQPDLVLVHGDTTSASIIAQAAFYRKIKVGHVEAGLRTYNKQAPYPEEINRQIIGRVADYHFVPTSKAASNLLLEQTPQEQITLTGNTVVDALLWATKKMEKQNLPLEILELKKLLDPKKKLVLVTGHRRENFGLGLEEICESLIEITQNYNIEVVYPVHFNPNVVSAVKGRLKNQPNIHLVPPVAYPSLLWLIKNSVFIISDSGGIQEEAPAFGKVVLVTREISERMEGVEAGFSILVGTNKKRIIEETESLLKKPLDFKTIPNPFGDGKAAIRIVEFLKGIIEKD